MKLKSCTKCKKLLPLNYFYKEAKIGDMIKEHGKFYIRKKAKYKPSCRTCQSELASIRGLKKKFGLSFEQYNDKLVKQNNVCAICFEPEIRKIKDKIVRMSVDHSHSTGKIRDLLCSRCNSALGNVRENIIIMESMIRYIKKHEEN